MTSRRRRIVAAVIGVAVMAAFVACSFPDVEFGASDGSSGPDALADGTTSVVDAVAADAQVADTSAPPQPDVDPEGGAQDAATRDANTVIDRDAGVDGGCGDLKGTFCDCDQDDSLKDAGAGVCVGPSGKPDCDDFDPLVHPGEGFVAVPWDSTSPHLPAGDWDCDGTLTKQYNYGIGCSIVDCTEGFATDVPCGIAADYNVCKASISILGISLCSVDHVETRTQGCR